MDLNEGTDPDDLKSLLELFQFLQRWTTEAETLGCRQPDLSGWSVGEHVDHLLTAARLNLMAIRSIPGGRGHDPDQGMNRKGRLVLTAGRIPAGTAQAPSYVLPRADRTQEQLERLRSRVHRDWSSAEFERELESIHDSGQVLPHFAVGELSARQWLRFALVHSRHHITIAESLLELKG